MVRRVAIAAVLLPFLTACGSSPSAPAAATPSTPAAAKANIGITSISVSGEARAVGQAYRVTVHLRESGGAAATITAADLTFSNGAAAVLSSHSDQPIGDTAAANVCPANGSVDTREFVVVDADASHAYATAVQAKITFSDASSTVATATASAAVPAPPIVAPQLFTLTGVITDASTHAGIAGARVEVVAGANAAKAATTDGGGSYVLQNLTADAFRLHVSASGYDPGEQGVTVPANSRADFEIRRTLLNYAGIWNGQYSITACQDINPPGLIVLGLCGNFSHALGAGLIPQTYRFTLSQSGAVVTGAYTLVTPMFDCPCVGNYGTFTMSGTVASDGTLALSAAGVPNATGLVATMTFTLRMDSASALTGTVSGVLSFGGFDRATFSGTITSGSR